MRKKIQRKVVFSTINIFAVNKIRNHNVPRQQASTVDAVTSSRNFKAKQKLGVTFNSDKLGDKNFTKSSHLDHVQWV